MGETRSTTRLTPTFCKLCCSYWIFCALCIYTNRNTLFLYVTRHPVTVSLVGSDVHVLRPRFLQRGSLTCGFTLDVLHPVSRSNPPRLIPSTLFIKVNSLNGFRDFPTTWFPPLLKTLPPNFSIRPQSSRFSSSW